MAFHRRSIDATRSCKDVVVNCSSQLDGEDAALLPAISSASEQQDKLRENTMQETLKELSDFLPLWVSQEQITDLLMSSEGDVVKAASIFFERERDFFEEANVSCNGTPKTEKNHSSNHGSSADVSSQQESPLFSQKPVEYSAKLVNLSPMRMKPNTPKKVNKRGSSNTNKPKKKG